MSSFCLPPSNSPLIRRHVMEISDAASAPSALGLPARHPDEIGGLLRDALKRSPGSSQRAYLERSHLGPEACALAAEALAIIANLGVCIEAARSDVDTAEMTLVRLRDGIEEVIKAA